MLLFCTIFLLASFASIWALNKCQLEGTALGTLVSPYCSGLGNLIFVYLALKKGIPNEVLENCLTNNWTNLTLVLGIPAVLWRIKASNSNTAVLALTFTALLYLLTLRGVLNAFDGTALVLSFILWQLWNLDASTRATFRPATAGYILLLLVAGYAVYWSLDGLVSLLNTNIGRFTGYLMVLPNAILAVYYGWKRQSNMVYASQVGDGHICIPLAIGITAMFHPLTVESKSILPLLLICVVHVLARGRISRIFGAVLIVLFFLVK